MDDEQLYNEWKQRRRQVAIPEGFSDRVMAGIRLESTRAAIKNSSRTKTVLMKWAISIGLTLLGLIRLSFVTYNLLAP